MKLSEAMRIGASWSKQSFGKLKNDDGTCALGSAVEGCFGDKYKNILFHERIPGLFFVYFNEILKYEINCPYDNCIFKFDTFNKTLEVLIMHLNDTHKLTREQIADWIEKIENKIGFTGVEIEKNKVELVLV